MPIRSDGSFQLRLRFDGWQWPAGTALLYAAIPLLAWRGIAVPPAVLALSLLLAAALVALSEIDRTSLRLPNVITLPLVLAGLLAAAIINGEILWHLLSAVLGFAFIFLVDLAYRTWRGFSGIGLGDAKLFGAAGAWLGAQALPTVLLWACGAALIVLLLVRVLGRKLDAHDPIPFGSFLAFGTWLVWCLGPLL
jgi:leader peptidase (prepilin peptidase) / N-methyltransferase